ncbi:MAG: type IVB secretion system protein DotG/IcmE [Legionella sp.]|nr:type IVB secretion system protein DotG/IcmE [Legionella sp.]
MAGRKENLKSLFSNTRTRVIILFTVILLLLAVGIGYLKFRSSIQSSVETSRISGSPDIQSIPGSPDPNPQYAKIQEEQNLAQAALALKTGQSALPTIIRTQAIGEGVGVIGSPEGKAGVGFATLARSELEGNQHSLWLQSLQNSACSQAAIQAILDQGGQVSDLRNGCTCLQLKNHGYTLKDLKPICNCKDLKAAGFLVKDLKDAGFTAESLRVCGFTACEQHSAGFSAAEMKKGGFSDGELKGAGFSDEDIRKVSGLPDNVSLQDVRNSGCDPIALKKLQLAGVSATAIRNISGCSAEQLRAAGFSAKDLRDAGFSAADLKNAGFTPEELKAAGFSAQNLKDAGFTAAQLRAAGFNANDLKDAGFNAEQLKAAGFNAKDLKAAGFNAADLKSAGFSADDLKAAGFSPQEIANALATPDAAATVVGTPASDCSVDSLKRARASGVSAATIKQTMGCSARALKDAGYSAKDLRDAGFTAAELKNGGFTPKELKDAGYSAKDLYNAGISAQALKDLGYGLGDLREAGISAADLRKMGFTAEQLKAAGFSAKDLKAAGFNANDLKAAGFDANELKAAGFSAEDLAKAGYSARDLKAAGFSADDLKKAGFNARDLRDAGFSATQLAQVGMNTTDDSRVAGLDPVSLPATGARLDKILSSSAPGTAQSGGNTKQLNDILAKQNQQMAEQKYQQTIQQKTTELLSAANASLQDWKKIATQRYVAGPEEKVVAVAAPGAVRGIAVPPVLPPGPLGPGPVAIADPASVIIKTGDILFAVLDTAVNSDEPGPILATIVSGKLKGSKLIGSFNLPSNSNRMVISFNLISMPGAIKTNSVSAVAIDPNTGRTALASRTNHHYLMRYGSLFASSFLEGFGNAFQSANTAITIGGTGGGNNITIQSGIGQSTLENAVIGLATVGKSWGQQAQLLMNRPTTVLVCAGTGIGVLFTQDVSLV